MGILGLAIIAIIGLFFLAGLYKGFIWNLATLGVSIIALLAAYLLMGPVSQAFVKDKGLYNAMLSYTEGSEAIYDVELVDRDIASLSNEEIDEVINRANLPFPLDERVRENIMNEAFKSSGITTLGDYFNESIISFILVYLILRVVLTFVVSWLDYSLKFPCLRIFDGPVGGAIGIVRGFIDISVLFMLVPIVLTVLPFDVIEELISKSAIASFLHRSNIFFKLIPGTV